MKIAISGSGGKIGYNLLFRMFTNLLVHSQDQLEIFCLEIPKCLQHMQTIIKEIEDCNFPQIKTLKACTVLDFCLCELDLLIILSSALKAPSESRDVLLSRNYSIFNSLFSSNTNPSHGHFFNNNKSNDIQHDTDFSSNNNIISSTFRSDGKNSTNNNINGNIKSPLVLVISNPANTMAWTTAKLLPFIPKQNIFSLSQLDHKRAMVILSSKLNCALENIKNLFILGNHSKTAVPIISFVTVNEIPLKEILNSKKLNFEDIKKWFENEFKKEVRERNYEMVKYRGFGSCCSVVTAILDNLKTVMYGNENKISTLGTILDVNKKGIEIEDLCVTVPVVLKRNKRNVNNVQVEVIDKIYELEENDKKAFLESLKELKQEKEEIKNMIQNVKK
eukprot:GAHX01001656.1.p1 GENE.GAHX01001656.1~~GAHX01001656.1.p1  ORF type:complete len:403 (-),score=88.20 GAHX01001656.1:39-1208(-)